MHLIEIEKLQKFIYNFDISEVTLRFSQKHKIDEDLAKRYELELKKYFLLRIAQKRRYGMNGLTDDLWHEFILSTQLYTDFCNEAFGRYLHHQPAPPETSQSATAAESIMYFRFLVDYFRFFEETPPTEIWPFSEQLFGDAPEWKLGGICIAPCFTRCNL